MEHTLPMEHGRKTVQCQIMSRRRRSGAAAAEACHRRDLTVQHVRDTPAHGCTVRGRQGAHLHSRAITGRSCIGRRGCGTIHACVLLSVGEGAHLHGRAQHEQVLDGLHKHTRPRLGQADRADGLLLAAVLHGHVVPAGPACGCRVPYPTRSPGCRGGARRKRCRARRLCLAWLGASRVRAATASAPSCGGAPLGRHAMQRPLRGACGGSAATAAAPRSRRLASYASGAWHAPVSLLCSATYIPCVSTNLQPCMEAPERTSGQSARGRASCPRTPTHA